MLNILHGNPGSGKTYFAVYQIAHLSAEKQKKVLHNIEGLQVGTTFESIQDTEGYSIQNLFSYKLHKNNDKFHGYLFVLDEASSIFHDKFQDPDVFEFFQKHRHLGIDIILITPDWKLLSFKISIVAEYSLRAVSDTANPLPFTFLYKKMVGFESVGSVFLRKKQKVFDLYTSANFDQSKVRKKSRPMLRILLIFAVLVPLSLYLGKKYIIDTKMENKSVSAIDQKKPIDDSPNNTKSPENVRSKTTPNSEQQNFTEKTYSESIIDKIGGTLMPLSVIQEYDKLYVVFKDMLVPSQIWPYQIIQIKNYYFSVVPLDVYENLYVANKRSNYNTDPNENYYWKGGQESGSGNASGTNQNGLQKAAQ